MMVLWASRPPKAGTSGDIGWVPFNQHEHHQADSAMTSLAESIGGKVHCTIACIAFNGYADNVRCRTQVLVALDRAGSFRRLGIFPIALNTGRGNMQAADGWRFPGTN
jgi:hypothetical protein